jgi:hypothetical protein
MLLLENIKIVPFKLYTKITITHILMDTQSKFYNDMQLLFLDVYYSYVNLVKNYQKVNTQRKMWNKV